MGHWYAIHVKQASSPRWRSYLQSIVHLLPQPASEPKPRAGMDKDKWTATMRAFGAGNPE